MQTNGAQTNGAQANGAHASCVRVAGIRARNVLKEEQARCLRTARKMRALLQSIFAVSKNFGARRAFVACSYA
jgi:hypothetical protein